MTENLRVVADSNVLFSAVRSRISLLRGLWTLPKVDILISQYVIGEVSRHLVLPDQRARLWQVLYSSHLIDDGAEIALPAFVDLPAKDRPILQSAIASRADILITGDFRHFAPLFGQTVQSVLVESTSMFKGRYSEHFLKGIESE